MQILMKCKNSKKSTTFLKNILTHLIRYYPYLILRIFPMRRENYLNLNKSRIQMVQYSMRHTISQMVRMMIAGITGALITGEQSGMFQNLVLIMMMMKFWNLHFPLRGVHLKELLRSWRKNILIYHSLVSMMNQEWRLQGTIRTLCKLSTGGCVANNPTV